jgi:hypothetical protein
MGCCKAKEYGNWCADVEIVHTDAEGKEYCLFHAPVGCKGEHTAESFNDRVYERIANPRKDDGRLNLSGTVFQWDIAFALFNDSNPLPEIDFSGSQFIDLANFDAVVFSGYAIFNNVTFGGRVEFRKTHFKSMMLMSEVIFNRDTLFLFTNFSDGIISECIIDPTATVDLMYVRVERSLCIENMKMNRIFLEDIDLQRVRFENVDWEPLQGRRFVFNEAKANKAISEQKPVLHFSLDLLSPSKVSREELSRVRTLYNQLKQKYKNEHNEAEASAWHYSEKEMRWRMTGLLPNPLEFTMLWLYRLSSRYAEDPVQAAGMLLALLLGIGFGLVICGLDISSTTTGMDVADTVFDYATLKRSSILEPTGTGGRLLRIFANIAVPIQAALLGLAVRNRFRR